MPTFSNLNALVQYINDNITTNGNGEITGARHREVLQTVAQSLHAMTSAVPGAEVMDFDPWDAGTTYTGGQEVVVRHDDKLWLFISGSDSIGTEPGTDGLVWQEMSALHLAHFKDEDQYLDKGGSNQVSAMEIRAHLDAPGGSYEMHESSCIRHLVVIEHGPGDDKHLSLNVNMPAYLIRSSAEIEIDFGAVSMIGNRYHEWEVIYYATGVGTRKVALGPWAQNATDYEFGDMEPGDCLLMRFVCVTGITPPVLVSCIPYAP